MTHLPDRARWLARPWFFVSVALLALNDHVLKAVWPGVVTGKLSDFAGLVVVGTLAAVLFGRSLGTALAGLGFAGLKLVPGVAELASPFLGGGIILRDASDLIALTVLPVLWFALQPTKSEQSRRGRRGWQVVGVIAAALATTATSPAPPDHATNLGYRDGAFFAEVRFEGYGSRWITSDDGGANWVRASDPGGLPAATWSADESRQACATDSVCYRGSYTQSREETPYRVDLEIERIEPGAAWTHEASLNWTQDKYAVFWRPLKIVVNPDNSDHIVAAHEDRAFYRPEQGDWRPVDLIEPARDPASYRALVGAIGSPLTTLGLCLVLIIINMLLIPSRSARIATLVLLGGAALTVPGIAILFGPVMGIYLNITGAILGLLATLLMRLIWRSNARRFPPGAPQRAGTHGSR